VAQPTGTPHALARNPLLQQSAAQASGRADGRHGADPARPGRGSPVDPTLGHDMFHRPRPVRVHGGPERPRSAGASVETIIVTAGRRWPSEPSLAVSGMDARKGVPPKRNAMTRRLPETSCHVCLAQVTDFGVVLRAEMLEQGRRQLRRIRRVTHGSAFGQDGPERRPTVHHTVRAVSTREIA
jgi:hypothetical protein